VKHEFIDGGLDGGKLTPFIDYRIEDGVVGSSESGGVGCEANYDLPDGPRSWSTLAIQVADSVRAIQDAGLICGCK
jgi:hypothetical protein